jgi:hypothetical protein
VARPDSANGARAYGKDSFHDYVIKGDQSAVNPVQTGTKAAAHHVLKVPSHGMTRVRFRLSNGSLTDPFGHFDKLLTTRHAACGRSGKRASWPRRRPAD